MQNMDATGKKQPEPFRRTWQLRGILRDYLAIRRTELREDDEIVLDPLTFSIDLDWWLQDPVYQRVLVEIWESSSPFGLTSNRLNTLGELVRFLKPRLEELFLQGGMVLIRQPKTIRSWGEPAEEEPEERPVRPAPAPRPELTWIEVELVWEDDGQPVPNEAYTIELTDGTTRKGTLDSRGFVRFDQIPSGECKVTFPKLDGREWRRA